MRKLDDFGSLSLRAVDEFKDGGLHPGLRVPALARAGSRSSRSSPASIRAPVVLHESSILTPLALVLAFEMGRQVFRSTPLAVADDARAGRDDRARARAAAARTRRSSCRARRRGSCFVPAVIALFFRFVREPTWPVALTLAVAGMDLAFVHPTYALFIAMPLVGYALVRVLAAQRGPAHERRRASLSFGVPVIAVFAWLEPIVDETLSHTPSAVEKAHAIAQYATDLSVHSALELPPAARRSSRARGRSRSRRSLLTPLAALAARRRWSALVLGGTVARARARATRRSSSRTSPTSCRCRSRGARPASCRSRSRWRAVPPC